MAFHGWELGNHPVKKTCENLPKTGRRLAVGKSPFFLMWGIHCCELMTAAQLAVVAMFDHVWPEFSFSGAGESFNQRDVSGGLNLNKQLVGGLVAIFGLFSHEYWVAFIIPIDEVIFFRGVFPQPPTRLIIPFFKTNLGHWIIKELDFIQPDKEAMLFNFWIMDHIRSPVLSNFHCLDPSKFTTLVLLANFFGLPSGGCWKTSSKVQFFGIIVHDQPSSDCRCVISTFFMVKLMGIFQHVFSQKPSTESRLGKSCTVDCAQGYELDGGAGRYIGRADCGLFLATGDFTIDG